MKTLKCLGVPDDIRRMAEEQFKGDPDGLTVFVLSCLARYDDRHEYVG